MPVRAPLNSFTHCYAELRFCRSLHFGEFFSAEGSLQKNAASVDRLILYMLDRNLRLLLWFLFHASSVF